MARPGYVQLQRVPTMEEKQHILQLLFDAEKFENRLNHQINKNQQIHEMVVLQIILLVIVEIIIIIRLKK